MKNSNVNKYRKGNEFQYENRTWPSKKLTEAPIFCSVDLRDGNQALENPMSIEAKVEFFEALVNMGFKEIEIGFPSASQTEYDFLRKLVEDEKIPEDVTIQVLVQAREHLIKKTYEALVGVKKAVVHVYNSTSKAQREMVFKKSKDEIKEIATNGATLVKRYAQMYPETEYIFQYSPESFTGTEMEYALEVCEAVMDVWKPTPEKKVIINLPATVEMTTPNVYADQIEWFCHHLKNRDSVIVSLHTHNDRGTGIAATELGIMAGADRVEGTLFGNGERTGNLDLLTLAMNYYSQGVEPNLYVEDIKRVIDVYERCTGMTIHERHPYVGRLVYTAFSGSHQDAIRKGLETYHQREDKVWDVPYLPIDPKDIGRKYEPIIRINSQSGKGGVAFVLETDYGFKCPKAMHQYISEYVQVEADRLGREITNMEIYEIFMKRFVNIEDHIQLHHISYSFSDKEKDGMMIDVNVTIGGVEQSVFGTGNGVISAFFDAIKQVLGKAYEFMNYEEHALTGGHKAEAAAYIQIRNEKGEVRFGVGTDANISNASIKAIVSALNQFSRETI
jgi:2-isopropylmalate synthase